MGDKRILYVDTAQGSLAALVPGGETAPTGESGWLCWRAEDTFVFPSTTETT